MLTDRIAQDLITAQKARDPIRVSALRMLRAAIQTAAIAAKPKALDDASVVQVIRKSAKQRKESIEAFQQGGRQDLVARETAELAILEQYLPAAVSSEDIRRVVQAAIRAAGATSVSDLGRVMKQAMTELAGRADGAEVQRVASDLLRAGSTG